MTGEFQALADELVRRAVFEMEMNWAMAMHEGFYGVPCGPTLSMVHPRELRGLAALLGE